MFAAKHASSSHAKSSFQKVLTGHLLHINTSNIGLVDWHVAKDKTDKNACFWRDYTVRNSQYKL